MHKNTTVNVIIYSFIFYSLLLLPKMEKNKREGQLPFIDLPLLINLSVILLHQFCHLNMDAEQVDLLIRSSFQSMLLHLFQLSTSLISSLIISLVALLVIDSSQSTMLQYPLNPSL